MLEAKKEEKIGSYSLTCTEFEFWKRKRLPEVDSSNVCTTMWMYLIPLSYTIENTQEGKKKKKKKIQIAKENVKLSWFEYNTVLYTENLDSKKQLEQINKFINASEYKINTQKNLLFYKLIMSYQE